MNQHSSVLEYQWCHVAKVACEYTPLVFKEKLLAQQIHPVPTALFAFGFILDRRSALPVDALPVDVNVCSFQLLC